MRVQDEVLGSGVTRARRGTHGRRALTWAAILAVLVMALILVLPATGALAAVTLDGTRRPYRVRRPRATGSSLIHQLCYTQPDQAAIVLMLVGVSWNCGSAA